MRSIAVSPAPWLVAYLVGSAGQPAPPAGAQEVTLPLAGYDELRKRARGWLAIQVRQGRLEELRVPIPTGFEVVDVGGDAIAGWDSEGDRLVVTPLEPVAERLRLELDLAADAATELTGPRLVPEGAASVLAATKVHVRGDGLLELVDAGAGRQPDSRQLAELPAAFRSTPGLALAAAERGAPGAMARWRVDWADDAEVLAAQVDRLRVDVVIGDAGRAGYQLWAEVRNRGAKLLAVELPAGAELIAAHRDGRRIEPGRSPAGWTVPLAAGDTSQVIHLSGVVPLTLPESGRFDLPVPAFSAPAARVEVSVWLPEDLGCRLVDDGFHAALGPPPAPRTGATAVPSAPEPFSRPPGFHQLTAAWSALAAAPGPLAIRIMNDEDRRRWF